MGTITGKNEIVGKSITELLENVEDNILDIINKLEDVRNEVDDILTVQPNESDSILSVDDFIWRLKLDNLYTPELEKFIEEYIKFYNK